MYLHKSNSFWMFVCLFVGFGVPIVTHETTQYLMMRSNLDCDTCATYTHTTNESFEHTYYLVYTSILNDGSWAMGVSTYHINM